ncbi:hypothetical protein HELRODRAFT_175334 [Helobdella robusta]|uniref:Apple domain-containing protein n=1 Tax=Helobdella robusta TaxID=6412 RepID=T1F956_HELRO|nr:hypothetical protein HELRODRAFT_175334 [Helobdella robusta]ESO00841.1 hypothetical protein HELRODRAFT_175334 [Helobdella robusta]
MFKLLILTIFCYLITKSELNNVTKCFRRAFDCYSNAVCSCKSPSFIYTSSNYGNYYNGYLLSLTGCSKHCQSFSDCYAFNYLHLTSSCQFYSVANSLSSSCFMVDPKCDHYFLSDLSYNLRVSSPNGLEIYTDGSLLASYSSVTPNLNLQVNVSMVTSVLAIKGWSSDLSGTAALIAVITLHIKLQIFQLEKAFVYASSGDNRILTDSSWKCNNNYTLEWTSLLFDDSSWRGGQDQSQNPNRLVYEEPSKVFSTDIYCRKKLVPYGSSQTCAK